MKSFIVFAALLVMTNAFTWPNVLPPKWRPRPPISNLPEGIRPLPKPLPPTIHPDVLSEVLNFPSDDDPQIRIHVNVKQEPQISHRPARSLLPPTNQPRPPIGQPEVQPMPELPPIGQPEVQPMPELPPGLLPSEPELPTPSLPGDSSPVYTYYNPSNGKEIVKLRVQYNHPPEPEWITYKINIDRPGVDPLFPSFPGQPGVDPIYPSVPETPGQLPSLPERPEVIPMPPPIIHPKQPQVELFLDIGEQD